MLKKISVALCGLAMIAGSLSAQAEGDKAKIAERLTAANQVIEEIMATPDKAIPGGILAYIITLVALGLMFGSSKQAK